MSPQLDAIANRAKDQPHAHFTALAHHLTADFLEETWQQLNQYGAPGLSGETMDAYDRVRRTRIPALVETLKAHAYRVPPIRRVYIPKAGQPQKRRPLGIPEVEDRLLQAAVNRLLQPIYEADFVEGSYGFRPGRSPHDALDALATTIMTRPMQWVFEADIRGFFDHLQHGWLMTMLRERIGDPGVLRLIEKWLQAPIVEPDGSRSRPREGAPQGGPLSPILGNVYLHYALDLWFEKAIQPACRGEAQLIRFADDFVVVFAREEDARRFATALPARLAKFGLELAPEKTRLMSFGRHAWHVAEQQGMPSARFDFLGFTHFGARSRAGHWGLQRRPTMKSRRKFLVRVKSELHRLMHAGVLAQQRYLQQALRGFNGYFGYPGCTPALETIRYQVSYAWYQVLRRRSQRSHQTKSWYFNQPWFWLPGATLRPRRTMAR
jgi:group II intron reverse transcriptase/maturase